MSLSACLGLCYVYLFFGYLLLLLLFFTFLFYIEKFHLRCFFSFQWRTKFRKAMNKADNDASTRAIDSLINYEVRLRYILWMLFC